MRRLTITHDVVPFEEGVFLAPDGTPYRIRGRGDGLDQIAEYAQQVAAESGDTVVCFEVFWPWETEARQTWDAVQVDVSKIPVADPDDWWVTTLPPYADLTPAQRAALGIEGDYA
jgi:hypothetical protein